MDTSPFTDLSPFRKFPMDNRSIFSQGHSFAFNVLRRSLLIYRWWQSKRFTLMFNPPLIPINWRFAASRKNCMVSGCRYSITSHRKLETFDFPSMQRLLFLSIIHFSTTILCGEKKQTPIKKHMIDFITMVEQLSGRL